MKGLVLCGGMGTRLKPITNYLPKQLIPIANEPLIFETIRLLLSSGIREIGIVVNMENKEIFNQKLEDEFKMAFKYIVQEESKGIANALLQAEDFIGGEDFLMILGDNSFELDLKELIDNFKGSKSNCKLLLKEVDNPEKYGVAYIGDNKIISLVEKPRVAYSNLAVTGIYLFDNKIFQACKSIEASSRGEYEITDAISWMINKGYNVDYEIFDGYWKDVGSHGDVIDENINRLSSIKEKIEGSVENSHITGNLILDQGGLIYNSVIRGPVIIGKNSVIKNSYIGPYTSIGQGVNISRSNIESSIILDNCSISSGKTPIDSSILGKGSSIRRETGLKTINRFLTGENTIIYLKSEE